LTALENLHEIDTETECITIDVRDEIDALRAALVSAAQPVAVLPGYVLVPVEPTAAMLQAILSEGEADAALDCPPEVRGLLIERAGVPQRYAAMLAAAPNAVPAQCPTSVDAKTMELAESVGLIGPASRTHDLHAAIQRFHDLVCVNATIKAAQMASDAIREVALAAQGDAEDAARLDWLLGEGRSMAIDSCDGDYRVVDAKWGLVVTDWMPTPRAAIDAARAAKEWSAREQNA
jgi:hypothetical protein